MGIDRKLLEIFSKYLIVAGCLSLASAFLFCFSAYLVVKIYRVVNVKDPPILLSIMSILCALGCFTTYLILDMLRILSFDTDFQFRISLTIEIIQQLDRLKAMFMFISFVFDLYKQSVFIASTGIDVQADYRVFLRRHLKLQIATIGIQSFFIAASVSLVVILIT